MAEMQNATGQGGASRNQLGRWLQESNTTQEHQTQRFIARYRVSQSLASTLARIAYGDAAND